METPPRPAAPASPAPPRRYPSHHRPIARRPDPAVSADLNAALEARRDLGPEYEAELVEGFLERLDETIQFRVDARVAEIRTAQPPAQRGLDGSQLALAIVTTAIGIPLTAITLALGSPILTVVVWAAIVAVNIAGAMSRRR